jgi:hypothetical protein
MIGTNVRGQGHSPQHRILRTPRHNHTHYSQQAFAVVPHLEEPAGVSRKHCHYWMVASVSETGTCPRRNLGHIRHMQSKKCGRVPKFRLLSSTVVVRNRGIVPRAATGKTGCMKLASWELEEVHVSSQSHARDRSLPIMSAAPPTSSQSSLMCVLR